MKSNNETNGCGACGGIWKFLKPPHHKFFKGQCDKHDEAYYCGGSNKDRLVADVNLLTDMVQFTTNYFGERKPISREWYIILSYFYYLAVRAFGKSQFNYNDGSD